MRILKIFKYNLLVMVLLAVIGFSLYAPNLNNRLFWDDDDWIVNNPSVQSVSWDNIKFIFSHDTLAGIGLRSNYYRPFLFLTFMANYAVSGIKPIVFHLTNNFLHILNAILIFLLLEKVIKKRRAAVLAALLFLIHPLQTEAVTYVSGRGDPLSVFFMLLALHLWTTDLRSRNEKIVDNFPQFPQRHSMALRGLSIVSVILAMLSRETAFLFPLYFVVFSVAFLEKGRFWPALKRSVIQAWPFWIVSFTYGILRLTVLNFQNTLNFYQQSNFYTEHLSYRIYTFFHVFVVYLKLIFVPVGLHMERDVVVNSSIWQWPVWFGALIVLLIIVTGFVLYKKENSKHGKNISDANNTNQHTNDVNNYSRNSHEIRKLASQTISGFRLWLFAWGIFFINLAPTSGIFPINALIYEHWLYFSLFGFFVLLAYYLDMVFDYLRANFKRTFIVGLMLFSVYLVFLGVQTIRRNVVWGKTEDFYKNILYYETQNIRALNNLAMYYSDNGKTKEAEDLYWQAIDANNTVPAPYYNLGNILRDRGDIAGAVELYKESIKADPNFIYGYMNIAVIYANQGNLVGAAEMLEKVKKLRPSDPRVYYNLGLVYLSQNNRKEAVANLRDGLKYAGNDNEVRNEITRLLTTLDVPN